MYQREAVMMSNKSMKSVLNVNCVSDECETESGIGEWAGDQRGDHGRIYWSKGFEEKVVSMYGLGRRNLR